MARGGRGGRRGGGDGGAPSRNFQISKKLSWLLRHGAVEEGLKVLPGAYINLAEVLHNRKIKSLKVSLDEIRQVVAESDKQRFSLIHISEAPVQAPSASTEALDEAATGAEAASSAEAPAIEFEVDDTDPANWLIRANQGHSIKIDEEGLLEPLTLDTPDLPTTVVHGTTGPAWPVIYKSGGLKPMSRTHVHFASGLPAGFASLEGGDAADGEDGLVKQPVISGMRNSSKILIYLDLRKALVAGLKVWRSTNGVILCRGNEQDVVPMEYFKLVECRSKEGGVLMRDGVLLER